VCCDGEHCVELNPFHDKQPFYAPQNLTSLPVCFAIFCWGCKPISQRAARRLIVLHPKQNIESELKKANLFWHGAKQL